MYYHFAILLLFGPFLKLSFLDSPVSPIEICTEAAAAITSLISTYRRLYTLKRTPCFVPYIVLASSIMRLAATEARLPQLEPSTQILQGTADLIEMIPSHAFACRGTQVLHIMAQNQADEQASKFNVRMGEDQRQIPTTSAAINFFSSDMENILLSKYSATQNSIFSPYPTQVVPLLAVEKLLLRDGFELIK